MDDAEEALKIMPSLSLPVLESNPSGLSDSRSKDVGKEIFCYCSDSFCENDTCSVVGGQCFHSVHSVKVGSSWEAQHVYGCAFPEADRSQLQCHGHLTSSRFRVPQNISCCDNKDLCNLYLEPELQLPAEKGGLSGNAVLILGLTVAIGLVLLVLLAIFWFCKWQTRKRRRQIMWKHQVPTTGERWKLLTSGEKKAPVDEDEASYPWDYTLTPARPSICYDMSEVSSGSGSGTPTLIQTTIARQLQFEKNIGKGRYGEVFMARWRGEEVAVKVFFTTEEASWENEKEIYQSTMLRHENVLGFIAADIRGHQSVTEMLLVTDYHPFGSLYDFLKREPPIKSVLALRLASSAASGLCHLHSEFRGTQEKSAIAHRDIKSKNILVKANGECAIADFGLAVRKDRDSGEAVVRRNNRVGTKRYMSPEVLNNSLNSRDFNGYTQADMYAFALVLWEISGRVEEQHTFPNSLSQEFRPHSAHDILKGQHRMQTVSDDSGVSAGGSSMGSMSVGRTCTTTGGSTGMETTAREMSGEAENLRGTQISPGGLMERPKSRGAMPYTCPFGDLVPSDPSFDQMRKIVSVDRLRPAMDEEWFQSENLKAYVRIVKECWREKPDARLNALRVKKNLKDLYEAEKASPFP